MRSLIALIVISLLFGFGVFTETSVAATGKTVNCNGPNASIQAAVDAASGPTIINIKGVCEEDVLLTKDDLTLDGQDVGTVSGTLNFDGAQRGVVQNMTVTGPGAGIVANHGASVLIQDNTITANGEAGDNYSPGIGVYNGASAQVLNNDITDNAFGDGVGVFNGAFAMIVGNTITGNGRASPFYEGGIQVARAVARGRGNIIRNNPYVGVTVFNMGSYRTGSYITAGGQEDNDGPFEIIDVGENGELAAAVGQMSFLDLRQVLIKGIVHVGFQSMVQVRGDGTGPSVNCSLLEGALFATDTHALARLRSHVYVTGPIFGTVDGTSQPIGDCPNLPLP